MLRVKADPMDRTIVPNATLFPLFLSDEVMPLVSSDEWKLIHFGAVAAMRADRGDDPIGLAQFVQGTGLSEERVRECLDFLCDSAQVFLRQDRPRRPHGYRLNQEISAALLEVLVQRQRGAVTAAAEPADQERQESALAAADLPPRSGTAPRSRGADDFAEHPSIDLVLGADDQPVARRLRQTLPVQERAAFDHLLRHYPRAKREGEESEVWGIFRLWQTYGFACLNNALQGAQPSTDLGELNRSCLLNEIGKLYEQEIGRLTPGLQDELTRLSNEYPSLIDWREAFRLAIKLNRRRLTTVETILKNQRIKAMEEAQRSPATPGQRTGATTSPVQEEPPPDSAES